jgi:WD40 repeat protein
VAAAAALVAVLLAGLSMTLVQYGRAQDARTLAEVEQAKANRARSVADAQKQVAEAALKVAAAGRDALEQATAEANRARVAATREADAADAARREAEYRTYVATIAAADGEIRANFHGLARERLLAVPADRRGWEWHHLFLKSDPSLVTLTSKTPCTNRTASSGREGAVLSQTLVAPSGPFHWRSLGALVLDEGGTRISFRRCSIVESWVGGALVHVTTAAGQILASGPEGDLLTPVARGTDQTTWEVHRFRRNSTEPAERFGPFERQPVCAAVSPDGRRVAIGLVTPFAYVGYPLDDEFEIWDAEGPRRVVRMSPKAPPLDNTRSPTACLVTFSPDSSLLATSSGVVRVWRADTGAVVAADLIQAGRVSQPIAFSPDATRLAIGRPTGLVDVLHLGAAHHVEQLSGNRSIQPRQPPRDADRSPFVLTWRRNEVLSIAFSPDGRRIVTGTDVNVGVWDVAQGALTAILPGHAAPVAAVAVTRDGDVVTGDVTGTIKAWPRDLGDARTTLTASFSHKTDTLAVSADDSMAAIANHDGGLSAWRLAADADRKEVVVRPGSGRMVGQINTVLSMTLTSDGSHLLSGESDGTVRTQTTTAGVVGTAPVNVVFEPGCAHPNRPSEGITTKGRYYAPVWAMALGPDGRSLAAQHGICLIVRDLLTHKTLAILHELPTGFAFRPDGTLLVASDPQRGAPPTPGWKARPDVTIFRVWDWRRNTTTRALPVSAVDMGPVRWNWRIAMSADGRRAIFFGNFPATTAPVLVFDGNLDKQIGRLPEFDASGATLSADGTRIATTHLDGAVRVWDADRLQLLLTLTDDDQYAGGIAFTRDGRLVAVRSTGGLTVWETQKRSCVFCLPGRSK